MGFRRARLRTGQSYEDLVALWRIAEMLRDHQHGVDNVIAIRTESDEHDDWDDVVEELSSGHVQVWQVKRQFTPLAETKVHALVQYAATTPTISRATIVTPKSVDVGEIGSLHALHELTTAAREAGLVPGRLGKRKKQQAWWSWLATFARGLRPRAELAARLDFEATGEEDELARRIDATLAAVFKGDVSAVRHALGAHLAGLSVSAVVSPQVLEDVLDKFAERRLPTVKTRAFHCRSYLRALVSGADRRAPLQGLLPAGSLPATWLPTPRLATRESPGDFRHLSEWLERLAVGRIPLLLVGSAGAGKTEALHRAAAEQAQVRLQAQFGPLPVVLNALDVVRGDLLAAGRRACPGAADSFESLYSDSDVQWRVFLDGLDETGEHAARVCERVAAELGDRLHGMVSTTRPTLQASIVGAQHLELRAWTDAELSTFLGRYEASHQRAVERLRAPAVWRTVTSVCLTPLLATFAVLLAEDQPDALKNRASLYRAATARMFQLWAGDRAKRSGGTAPAWHELAPSLQVAALEFCKGHGSPVSRASVERIFSKLVPNRELEVEVAAVQHFGLLVPCPGGGLEFPIRGIAEHLAGSALLDQGDAMVASAAREPWGEEPVRHAVGCAADREPERVSSLVDCLLAGEESEDVATSIKHLRRVGVTAEAVADIGAVGSTVAAKVAQACMRRLLDETSTWVPREMSMRLLEAGRRDGPLWRELLGSIKGLVLYGEITREVWLANYQGGDGSFWRERLLEASPEVRCIAVRKLSQFLDDAQSLDAICGMMADESFLHGWEPPALVAARVIRLFPRDGAFDARRDQLLLALRSGGQLLAQAAATALLPTEAPVEELVDALHRGHGGARVDRSVLDGLLGVEGGRAVLDQRWPNWDAECSHRAHSPEYAAHPAALPPYPPVSSITRGRLVRTLSGGLAPPGWHALSAQVAPHDAMAAFCDMAVERPELMTAALVSARGGASPGPWLSRQGEEALGRALLVHDELRDALYSLWHAFEKDAPRLNWRSLFPGGALEGLVLLGDSEAARIYATWLPHAQDLIHGTVRFERPRALFDVSAVRLSARAHVDHLLRLSQEPREYGSVRSRVGAAMAMNRLAPCWHDDQSLLERAVAWASSYEEGDLWASLCALEGAVLDSRALDAIGEAVAGVRERTDPQGYVLFTVPRVIRFAWCCGVVGHFAEPLLDYAMSPSPVASAAAAVLLDHLSAEDGRKLSTSAASSNWTYDGAVTFPLPDKLRGALVGAAPEAWADAVESRLGRVSATAEAVMLLVVRELPSELKVRVARKWAQHAGRAELPWLGHIGQAWRPADRVRWMLYELGIESELA